MSSGQRMAAASALPTTAMLAATMLSQCRTLGSEQ